MSTATLPETESSLPPVEMEETSAPQEVTESAESTEAVGEDVVLEAADEPVSRVGAGGMGGFLASFLFHVWLIVTLATALQPSSDQTAMPPLVTTLEPFVEKEKEEKPVEYQLANPSDKQLEVRKVQLAQSVGLEQVKKPEVEKPPEPIRDEANPQPKPPAFDIPKGTTVSKNLVIQGTTGDHFKQIESALDRITHEIANKMEEGKVLVVWLLDASGSLTDTRARVAAHLDRVYNQLGKLKEQKLIPDKKTHLLSAVATYGERTNFLTKAPTQDFDVIKAAIKDGVKIDESGRENVFEGVENVVKRWGNLKFRENRRTMVIVVTDEAGDDFHKLEPAIKKCRFAAASAYVLGPAAAFGKRQGYVSYTAEDGNDYDLPVDVGPEVPMMFNVDLPFWYRGRNSKSYRYISSGFPPYGLARLVTETNGGYFMTNMTTTETLARTGEFDKDDLGPFKPNYKYASPQEYLADVAKFPLRMACYKAASISNQNRTPATPRLNFELQPNNFRQTFDDAQRQVAVSLYRIEQILTAFPPELETQFAREPKHRWRLSYLLAWGRTLAQKARNLEYNSVIGDIKGKITTQDVNTTVNRLSFEPVARVSTPSARRFAKKAEELLKRVIKEAPNTPWSMLASRELRDGMGLQVKRRFVPPPPPPDRNGANNPNGNRVRLAPDNRPMRPRPMRKPAPKPKLPKL